MGAFEPFQLDVAAFEEVDRGSVDEVMDQPRDEDFAAERVAGYARR